MAILAREIIVNVRDPDRSGILRNFASTTGANFGSLVRHDTENWGLRLVEPATSGPNPWREIDLAGATIEIGLGTSDAAPTGGTFSVAYAGNGTGLGNLSGAITSAALQTALNANSARAAAGPVVVSKVGNSYIIEDTTPGARALLICDGSLLAPRSIAAIARVQTGATAALEIQVLTLSQSNYAFADTYTAYPSAGYVLDVLQTGDSGHSSIRRLTLDPPPYDGTWQLGGVALGAGASASDVQTALGSGYAVAQPSTGSSVWIITQTAHGAANTLAVNVAGLRVPSGAVVRVALNTYGMIGAFAESSATSVQLRLQCRLTLPGQDAFTFLLSDVSVSRDVLNSGTILPQLLGTYPAPNLVDTIALRTAAIATEVANRNAAIAINVAVAAANPPFAVIAFTGAEGFGHGTTLFIAQPNNGQGGAGGTINATFYVAGTYDLLSYGGSTGYYPMPGTASPAQETIMFSGQPSSGDTIFCTTIGYGKTITFVPTGNPGGVASLTCEIGATLNDTLNNYASSIGGGTVSGNTVVKFAPGPTGPGSYQDLFIYTVGGYNQSNTSGCSVASSSYNDGAITSLGGADALAGYIANGLNSANGYGGGYSQTIHDSANYSRGTGNNYYFTAVPDGTSIALHTNSEGPAGRLHLRASGGQAAIDGSGPLYSVTNLAWPDGLGVDTIALRNTAIAALANVARTGSYTDLTNKPIGGGSLVAVPADYNSASTPPCMALDLAGGFIYASTIANVWQRGSIVFGTFGSGGTQLNYVSDGDTNGLFFYLGQTHGSGIWGNPQTNGGLNISLSAGLIMGAGSLLALTDRAFNDNYTSVATATQGYIFTLPTGKSLTLNKWSYQIRNNAYAHIPLRLQIAGSNDGSTWTTLDNKALSSTAPASTWFTFTPASLNSTSYRYFMLTMPNNNDQNSGLITIGEFELYGVFH